MPQTPLPKWPTLNLERALAGRVCGVDEAGCAPIAGPVVAAAVILPPGGKPSQLRGLTDSKLLTAAARERFFDIIQRIGKVGVGIASVKEIDRLNIFRADMLAMKRAVEALGTASDAAPDAALVDGRGAPALACEVKTVVKGDRRSLSIAAASVIAKVTRDRIMAQLASECPGYGWHTNMGYSTDEHYLGLLRQGPTDHHRRSFAPLTTIFGPQGTALQTLRFEACVDRPDLAGLELLTLRRDLHAIFDGRRRHLGELKNRRGRWTFQATGYGPDRQPLPGAGPCAPCHGEAVAAPAREALQQLFAARLD